MGRGPVRKALRLCWQDRKSDGNGANCVMSFAEGLQRFGLLLPQGCPTVVLAGTREEIGLHYQAADTALRQRSGYRLVLATAFAELAELRQCYPHEIVLPLPHPASAELWRRGLDAVLILGPAGLVAGFGQAGLPNGSEVMTPERLAGMLPPLDPPKYSPPRGTFLVDLFGGRRIASLGGLKARLGNPRTIVCLGNGPSSEDPRLADYRDATLFRVNWNWRGRGWMTEPDIVFTADPDLPCFGWRPIVIFPTASTGWPILVRHTMAMRSPRVGYGFLDEFVPPLADVSGLVIPTNGALMIAIAAALAPERIVIAGMDLYQHHEGRYPGDKVALGGYSREHSAEIDLNLIRAALNSFAGEVIILSDNLRAALSAD